MAFQCSTCYQPFSQKRDRDRHMRNKHGIDLVAEKRKEKIAAHQPAEPFNFDRDVERNGFKCFHCNRVFISATTRDQHEISHFDL